jgi:hypothetical protein
VFHGTWAVYLSGRAFFAIVPEGEDLKNTGGRIQNSEFRIQNSEFRICLPPPASCLLAPDS